MRELEARSLNFNPLPSISPLSMDVSIILHNIRSSENVGSIFRTADAAGVSKVYVAGYTPAPLDRFKRKNAKLIKASLGAEESVPWEMYADIFELIERLKKEGIQIVAVEQSPQSIPYTSFVPDGPTAFIFGNEVEGVPQDILDAVDSVIEIPMHGEKESLNVSVTAGIILYSLIRTN